MTGTPQIILTLTPSGELCAELPGTNGMRRKIELKGGLVNGESRVEATLLRILNAQLQGNVRIGEDGAPDTRQVAHWERHSIWADPNCAHCIAEGRFGAPKKQSPLAKLKLALEALDSRKAPDGAYREHAGKRSKLARGQTWKTLAHQRLLVLSEKKAEPKFVVENRDGVSVRVYAPKSESSRKLYKLIDNPNGLLPLAVRESSRKPQAVELDLAEI